MTGQAVYASQELAERACRILGGGIDLDPATDLSGMSAIKARIAYTEADNGLSLPWLGRVWLFPPQDKPVTPWVLKAWNEITLGRVESVLLYSTFDSRSPWFLDLIKEAPVCFVGALRALDAAGQPIRRTTRGALLAALGACDRDAFLAGTEGLGSRAAPV